MGAIRTFISIETPGGVREEMRRVQSLLKELVPGLAWERPAQFHATLKFLGNVDEKAMPGVLEAVEGASASCSPFGVTYATLGAFPRASGARVVWVGCRDDGGSLRQLKERLDAALLPLGFPVEERDFHPHVTLGRVRGGAPPRNLTPMLEKCTFEPQNAMVDGIVVMKSVLTPQGAEHSAIRSIHLRAS